MEIFPEAPKELADNHIIDYPFNLELSNYIIFTSSDILRREFNGGFSELPVLLRNMWNNVLYSKGGSEAGISSSNDYLKQSPDQLKKAQASYEKLISKHETKLNDYIKDPYKYDNKNILKMYKIKM